MLNRSKIVETPAIPRIRSEIRIFKSMYFEGSAWGTNYFLEGNNTSPSGRINAKVVPNGEPHLVDYGFPY